MLVFELAIEDITMNKIIQKNRAVVFIISVCVLIATGCSMSEVMPPETVPSPIEITEDKDLPIDADAADEGTSQEEYFRFSEIFQGKLYSSFSEAYLDVLKENRFLLTNEQLSDSQKRMGMDIGYGGIAVVNVFGDDTPELLCIYTDMDVSIHLIILAYSEKEGLSSVIDTTIYQPIGGESHYCVYLTHDNELMVYHYYSGVGTWYGFWSILSIKDLTAAGCPERSEREDTIFLNNDNFVFAQLHYDELGTTGKPIYMQYGKEIPKAQFDKIGKEIMDSIERVLFQGVTYNAERGLELYYLDLWNSITPFEEHCMTYAEAVSWLEAQIRDQVQK